MKRYLFIFLCTLIILLCVFTLIKINTNNNILYKNKKILVAENNIYNKAVNANSKIEKIEIEKKERENKKEEKVKVINTSINNKKISTKKDNNINYGTFGRLYISNFSVALYDYNVNTNSNHSLQTIVNNNDSAAYYTANDKLVIADHSYQGFNILVNLKEGTTSYIKFKDGNTIKYKLIKKDEGINTGPDLVDNKGNSFFKTNSDIIMYTCYKDGIMVTLWALS